MKTESQKSTDAPGSDPTLGNMNSPGRGSPTRESLRGRPATGDATRALAALGGQTSLILGVLILTGLLPLGWVPITNALLTTYLVAIGLMSLGITLFSSTLRGWRRFGGILLSLGYMNVSIVLAVNLITSVAFLIVLAKLTISAMLLIQSIFTISVRTSFSHTPYRVAVSALSFLISLTIPLIPLMHGEILGTIAGILLLALGVMQIIGTLRNKST